MNRRELLGWVSRGLASSVATVIGLPGVRYLLGSAGADAASESQFVRSIRLKDLVPGRPTLVPILGQKQDAWTQSEQQLIGRVWLVRRPGESVSKEASVRALSGVCPHMGCQLQSTTGSQGFVCPCHRATFGVDGNRLPDPRTGSRNHAPRDLDELDCRLVQDETSQDWWVEVKHQKFKTGQEHRVVST